MNNLEEFKAFIHILLHINNDAIAYYLEPKLIDLIDLKRCDPNNGFKEKFSFGENNTKDILKIKEISSCDLSSSSLKSYYPMSESTRGFCLLINNYFTIGTFKEMQRF